jgi:hypothetical protein
MAQNMGFGSAVTGFGTGYLNALRQGRSEQNSLLNAKLRKDALQEKKRENQASGTLRLLQLEDLIDARKDRREATSDRNKNTTNKILFSASAKVSDFYTRMQPHIAAMNPDQRKTTHDSMRSSVRGMLVAGGFDPESADEQALSMIKPYGTSLEDEMTDVNVGPDMTNEGLMSQGVVPQSSLTNQFGGNAPMPDTDTEFQMQQDGTYVRVGTRRIDPSLRSYMGMQNYLGDIGNNLVRTAAGGRTPDTTKPNGGMQQYQDPTYGVTEQRQGIVKSVPATAAYGIDPKTQSMIAKNEASTKYATVRTNQLEQAFPDQLNLIRAKVQSIGASIKDKAVQTSLRSLNYDLDLREFAAKTAYQNTTTAIARAGLDDKQKNTALRAATLRMKSIIDPTRIRVNSAAIIGKLNEALQKPEADMNGINAEIKKLQIIQKRMSELEAMSTQPRQSISDASLIANNVADGIGRMFPELADPDRNRSNLLGSLPPQNIYEDIDNMSDDDYLDNQDSYETSPLAPYAEIWRNQMPRAAPSPNRRQSSNGIRFR